MAVIRSMTARPVRVPMTPHQTASGALTESPLVLRDITTDDGIVGHSITFTYTVAALKPTADLISNIAALIHGDALARSHNCSLLQLLGGAPKPVRAYGAIGFDGAAASAKCAEDWARRGFTGVKAKIGYPTATEDIEVIRAIRSAAGDRMAIMVDYNQSLTPTEAIERLRCIDDLGLWWIEEPTLAHDFAGHAQIAREIRTPIQCGENWWGVLDMRHAIDAGASDYMMPEVMKIGGVTGWMQAASLAAPHGIRVSNHLWPEVSAQLLCAAPTGHWLEYADWWNPILKEPLRVKDGFADVAGVAGTGVEWDEAALQRF